MAKKRVCLDAGHYGKYNRSPVVPEYYESDMTWKLTNLQKKYLEEYEGMEVVLTRSEQAKDLTLASRGKASKGADVFISNHSNACGTESVNRIVAICMRDDRKTTIDETSEEIAEVMAKAINGVMGYKYQITKKASSKDRDGNGLKDDEYYGVLHGAKSVGTPGMILEHGFHTNTATAKWLLDDSNLEKLAKAEAAALAGYFGCKKKTASTNPSTTTTTSKPTTDKATAQNIKALNGKVKVIYKGADGLNVRKGPSMNADVDQVVYNGTYTVVGISADGKWYKLKSGLYITTGTKYVKFTETKKSIETIAKEVIAGKWGNGTARKRNLEAAGYDYSAVQKKVNELLK